MGQLLSPETFEFFGRYLIAGYVVIFVRARYVTGLRPRTAELVVEAFILSLISQVLVLVIHYLWSMTGYPGLDGMLAFLGEILVVPYLFGTLLGLNLSRGWNNAVLRRLSAPVIHPAQRAHDFAFGHNRPAGLVIVSYFDGTVIRGYFGESSLAATDESRSDLFLERLYIENEDGAWVEQDPGRSALITLTGTRSIEFLDEIGDSNGKEH